MRIDSLFYRLAYRSGTPRWDSTEPRPELTELAKGRAPGRALDLGCGTGSDVLYLAGLGWDATGVDFVPRAIAAARSRAAASGSSASFTVGDVTRLREAGVGGQFDLVIDIGCYHAIPASHRDAYRDEVAAVTRPGGDLYLAGVTDPPATWRLLGARGLGAGDLRRRFGSDFELVDEQTAGRIGRAGTFVFYHLVRKRPGAADAARDITAVPVSTGPGSERPARRLCASCGHEPGLARPSRDDAQLIGVGTGPESVARPAFGPTAPARAEVILGSNPARSGVGRHALDAGGNVPPGAEKARTMKLITAIIRPDKLDELIQIVIENGGHGLTVSEVRGFGRQFGEPTARTVSADLGGLDLPTNRTAALLPKTRLDILVLDDDAETMVEAIAKRARTDTIGDGKIWVSTVDSAMRVRTGARDRHAI